MKIALTGGGGFIGEWLEPALDAAGHDVAVNFRDESYFDVRDPSHVAIGPSSGIDVVVHLAARVGRELCERDPMDVIATNAGGTMNVAKLCAESGARLVYISSSEAEWSGNLYGLTKRWGEEAAALYAPDDLQVLRLFMPYGPGHPPGRGRAALTNFLWQAMNHEPLVVHRETYRPWCWIGDAIAAIVAVIDDGGPGLWNIGRSDNVMSSLAVAKLAIQMVGGPARIEEVDVPANVLQGKWPDTERLLATGWRPKVDLEEGMRITYDWLVSDRLDEVAV
jgi:nucleoside-diphosphate-sugar epimerase